MKKSKDFAMGSLISCKKRKIDSSNKKKKINFLNLLLLAVLSSHELYFFRDLFDRVPNSGHAYMTFTSNEKLSRAILDFTGLDIYDIKYANYDSENEPIETSKVNRVLNFLRRETKKNVYSLLKGFIEIWERNVPDYKDKKKHYNEAKDIINKLLSEEK